MYRAIHPGDDRRVALADVDVEDHRASLHSLGRTQLRYPFRHYGYCLTPSRFHGLLRPKPGTTISRIFQSPTIAHTGRFHRRRRSTGHVRRGRSRRPVVRVRDPASIHVS